MPRGFCHFTIGKPGEHPSSLLHCLIIVIHFHILVVIVLIIVVHIRHKAEEAEAAANQTVLRYNINYAQPVLHKPARILIKMMILVVAFLPDLFL